MLNHYTTKMTEPLETWIIHLSFFTLYTVIQGVHSFLYCQNPYSHMKCLYTKIQSNIAIWQYIAIHSNAIRNMALTHIVSPLEWRKLFFHIGDWILHVQLEFCSALFLLLCLGFADPDTDVSSHSFFHNDKVVYPIIWFIYSL